MAAQGTGGGGEGGRGGWVQSHDVVQGGNGGPQQQQQQQSAATEVAVGGAGGGASQGESIQTMHRLLTQGLLHYIYIIYTDCTGICMYNVVCVQCTVHRHIL